MNKQKLKVSRKADPHKFNPFDFCQTPGYALDPLWEHLDFYDTVWEPACGEGNLVRRFQEKGVDVVGSDILEGHNFFIWQPEHWNVIVTNPPYTAKFEWLSHCYYLKKPFALLLPVETLGAFKAQRLFMQHGLELILMNRRINFKMPNKGWDGAGAWFPVAWFTHGLNIGQPITYANIVARPDTQMEMEL